MEKRYLTINEAMEYTGMGESTLLRMLKEAGVSVYQQHAGDRRFIDKEDIDKAFKKMKAKYNYFKRW